MGIFLVEKVYDQTDFTPLDEHNSQTPASFFAATPVLHLNCATTSVHTAEDTLTKITDLRRLSTDTDGLSVVDGEVKLKDIDVWVTSKYIAFSSRSAGVSLRIDYPTIAVHGQQGNAVMLVLTLEDDDLSNEDTECVQIHITPNISQAVTNGVNGTEPHESSPTAEALFKAIGDCQELNPGPNAQDDAYDDDDDAEDIIQPGAGGWITSDNMHEFVDEDGNFRMSNGTTLGVGAGATRTAEDATLDEEEEDESKWQRTG